MTVFDDRVAEYQRARALVLERGRELRDAEAGLLGAQKLVADRQQSLARAQKAFVAASRAIDGLVHSEVSGVLGRPDDEVTQGEPDENALMAANP
jgi:Tfp pilus assembly protein PilX